MCQFGIYETSDLDAISYGLARVEAKLSQMIIIPKHKGMNMVLATLNLIVDNNERKESIIIPIGPPDQENHLVFESRFDYSDPVPLFDKDWKQILRSDLLNFIDYVKGELSALVSDSMSADQTMDMLKRFDLISNKFMPELSVHVRGLVFEDNTVGMLELFKHTHSIWNNDMPPEGLSTRESIIWNEFNSLVKEINDMSVNLKKIISNKSVQINKYMQTITQYAKSMDAFSESLAKLDDPSEQARRIVFEQERGWQPSEILEDLASLDIDPNYNYGKEKRDQAKKEKKRSAHEKISSSNQAEKLAKEEKQLRGKIQEIYSNFWHSEQRLIYFLLNTSDFWDRVRGKILAMNGKVMGVFLHLHSRKNFCETCRHTLAGVMQPNGALRNKLFMALEKELVSDAFFTLLGSFRVHYNNDYKDVHNSKRKICLWAPYIVVDEDLIVAHVDKTLLNVPAFFVKRISFPQSDEIKDDVEWEKLIQQEKSATELPSSPPIHST